MPRADRRDEQSGAVRHVRLNVYTRFITETLPKHPNVQDDWTRCVLDHVRVTIAVPI